MIKPEQRPYRDQFVESEHHRHARNRFFVLLIILGSVVALCGRLCGLW